jgi:hypothetical protein
VDRANVRKVLERKEEAPLKIRTVSSKRVDIFAGVRTGSETRRCSPRRLTSDGYDVAVERSPFALDADKPRPKVEHEVVALPFTSRPEDTDAETGRVKRDRRLSDRALLIRRQLNCHVLSGENESDDAVA